MSADQYRQTQSPDSKAKKARQEECEVKQRMTTHWDMDYLSREELEAEMSRGFGHESHRPDDGPRPVAKADDQSGDEDNAGGENPFRIGLLLLAVSLAMMAGALLLLQSGGN